MWSKGNGQGHFKQLLSSLLICWVCFFPTGVQHHVLIRAPTSKLQTKNSAAIKSRPLLYSGRNFKKSQIPKSCRGCCWCSRQCVVCRLCWYSPVCHPSTDADLGQKQPALARSMSSEAKLFLSQHFLQLLTTDTATDLSVKIKYTDWRKKELN